MKELFKNTKLKVLETAQEEKPKENPEFMYRFVPTLNPVVDAVQAAILYHQKHFISLRTISLIPKWYEKFFEYMDREYFKKKGEPLHRDSILTMFNIDIKKGSQFQRSEMYFEQYTENGKDAIFSDKIRPDYNQ